MIDRTCDRLPPDSLEAERSVLGGMLLDNSTIDDVLAILSPADFFLDTHQLVFKAVADLRRAGQPAYPIVLDESLAAVRGPFAEDDERMRFLTELVESVPHAANTAFHAAVVAGHARKRRAIGLAETILRAGYDPSRSAEDVEALCNRPCFKCAIGERNGRLAGIGDRRRA